MVTDLELSLIFALRSTLLVLYGGVLFAYRAHAWDFIWTRESGDVLAAGVWLVAAGAMAANLNSMTVMVRELGTFHGSPTSVIVAMAGLWAGFFLIWNAWASATYDAPFRKVAVYSAAALAGVALLAGAAFLAAVLVLV